MANACDALLKNTPALIDAAGHVADAVATITDEQRAKAAILAPGLPADSPLLAEIAAGVARIEATQRADTMALLSVVKCSCPGTPAPKLDLSDDAVRTLRETRDAADALAAKIEAARAAADAGADASTQ
jgi:hypothetical protein